MLTVCAALLWPSAARGQDGLLGEYYDTTTLSGLVQTRIDRVIDFQLWGSAPPGTSVAADGAFSERWTGSVRVDQAGTWTFLTESNDGVRLWIDGQLVIDNWTKHSVTVDSGSALLSAGWHSVRLEHFQDGGSATIRLHFQGPGQPQVIVPTTHLSSTAIGNVAPQVELGGDLVVVLPDDDIALSGTVSDADGSVVSLVWQQMSGPTVPQLASNGSSLVASGLAVAGDYVFRLTATDDDGASVFDDVLVSVLAAGAPGGAVSGELVLWHRVTLEFAGPVADEADTDNVFRDRRLDVTFVHDPSGRSYRVPGFFAADGQAAESSATGGRVWRAHFAPDLAGTWRYQASFRSGPDVAASTDPNAGTPVDFDGHSGAFVVAEADSGAPGFRSEGRLDFVGEHHLRFAGSGRPFLKGGADSPENFLGYAEFDQTPAGPHLYGPHIADWSPGDPQWQGGRGRGIIGALNYLASKGMNSVYFLTFNVAGDGDDVWPWTSKNERYRFDCSKLDQWELVFDHMDALGLMLHVVTQEQENDNGVDGLDGGALGVQRKLYYRELVARFSHHLGVTWNLGEENTNTTGEQQAFYDFISALDPYGHPIVVHTNPFQQNAIYDPLLDLSLMEGASLQNGTPSQTHGKTLQWRNESASHGRRWVVTVDEIGPSSDGVVPDAADFWHDGVRKDVLWGSLMAGGAGCEWYFGYDYPNDDLDCEDWRSRDHMWELTRHALDFFEQYLPFDEMEPADGLVTNPDAWCLAQLDTPYRNVSAVYLPNGGSTQLDLGPDALPYRVSWFDPRNGGPLQDGSVTVVAGPGPQSLGAPPSSPTSDWAVLVERINSPPDVYGSLVHPDPYVGVGTLSLYVAVTDADGLEDIEEVIFYFFSTSGAYIGAAPAAPLVGYPGVYALSFPGIGPLPTGTWPVWVQVRDSAGAEDKLSFDIVAP